ncbi:MAG: ATP-binding protein [Roseiflexaceae bacterium]|jgi:signal transduction histidine kinase
MTQLPIEKTSDCSLSALMQIMDTANGTSDLEALGRAALEQALAMTTMASGSIWLHDQGDIVCLARHPARSAARLPQPDAAIRRVLETGQPEFHRASGTILPLIARGERIGALVLSGALEEPSRPLLGVIACWIGGALDQARLAGQLEAQQRHLQAIKHQQDELLAIVSHDLRNPMASIKGYADLLLRRSARRSEDPNRRGLQIISEQIVRMTDLLDQLLDISRISSERLRIDRRADDLTRVVSRLVAELHEPSGQLDLRLVGAEIALPCLIDAARIRQAIGNVLGNAIAYSPGGSPVEVRLEHDGQEAIISIRDDGIGIPTDEARRVFEPFFRASNAANYRGMGMGLFVAQQILLRHDGRVWFESAQGEGATFYIALPLSNAQLGA